MLPDFYDDNWNRDVFGPQNLVHGVLEIVYDSGHKQHEDVVVSDIRHVVNSAKLHLGKVTDELYYAFIVDGQGKPHCFYCAVIAAEQLFLVCYEWIYKVATHAEQITCILAISPNMSPGSEPVGHLKITVRAESLAYTLQSFYIIVGCSWLEGVDTVLALVKSQIG